MRRDGPWTPERMREAVDRSAAMLLRQLDAFWTTRAAALGCSVAQAQALMHRPWYQPAMGDRLIDGRVIRNAELPDIMLDDDPYAG